MSLPLESFFIPEDDGAQAAHDADMKAFEQEAREALIASLTRPLTPNEVSAISFFACLNVDPTKHPGPQRRPPIRADGSAPPF
jgi:hypothetical protein